MHCYLFMVMLTIAYIFLYALFSIYLYMHWALYIGVHCYLNIYALLSIYFHALLLYIVMWQAGDSLLLITLIISPWLELKL